MARIRTVKPEFFTHPEIVRLSIPARLLFLSLLTQADDEGRLYDQPKRIGANAFGEDDRVNPERLLAELAGAGRILRYDSGERRCILVEHFRKHQRVDRPSASVIPEPFDEASRNDSTNVPRTLDEGSRGEVEQGKEQGTYGAVAPQGENGQRMEGPYFDAILNICRYGPEALTAGLRARIAKFAREVAKTKVEPGFVLGFEEVWTDAHPGIPVTIGILSNHWGDYMAGNLVGLPERGRR